MLKQYCLFLICFWSIGSTCFIWTSEGCHQLFRLSPPCATCGPCDLADDIWMPQPRGVRICSMDLWSTFSNRQPRVGGYVADAYLGRRCHGGCDGISGIWWCDHGRNRAARVGIKISWVVGINIPCQDLHHPHWCVTSLDLFWSVFDPLLCQIQDPQ